MVYIIHCSVKATDCAEIKCFSVTLICSDRLLAVLLSLVLSIPLLLWCSRSSDLFCVQCSVSLHRMPCTRELPWRTWHCLSRWWRRACGWWRRACGWWRWWHWGWRGSCHRRWRCGGWACNDEKVFFSSLNSLLQVSLNFKRNTFLWRLTFL